MPIQVYKCECGIQFEAVLLTRQDYKDVCCPRCESKKIEQQWATCSFSMKVANAIDKFKRGPAHNPYENLTLDHVKDERGKPIKVNSRKEMEAAEIRYGFQHALSHALTQEQLDTPPQHEKWAGDIRADYEWKWQRDPAKQSDMSGVSSGVKSSIKETLAHA